MAQGHLNLPDVIQPINPLPPGLGFFGLRPYQHEAVDAAFRDLCEYLSTLIVLPTGMGKTVGFAEIALRWPAELGRVLVMAHREELIDQAADKMEVHMQERPGVEMGQRREQESGHTLLDRAKVLVTSVQTMSREKRMAKFNPDDFGLLIIDEAHHAPAESYRKVIRHFRQNRNLRVVGVTATPGRTDKAAMGDVFHSCCYQMDIRDGIEQGWLVDIEQKLVVVEGLDFSKCNTVGDDLNKGQLEAVMMGGAPKIEIDGEATPLQIEQIAAQEKMLHAIVGPTIEEAHGRPVIVFCVTKAHAERMAEIFRRHPGVTAECVVDDTDRELRKEYIRKFRAGQLQILTGCDVFTEGFDARVDVVAIAKPTKSLQKYVQMVGRGTRTIPGLIDQYHTAEERREAIANSLKPRMTVLDFVGVSGRHKLCSTADILGGDYTEDVINAVKERIKETGEVVVMSEALEAEKEAQRIEAERIAEEKKQKFIREQEERTKAQQERAEHNRKMQEREEARRAKLRADVKYRTKNTDPFGGNDVAPQVGVSNYRGGATDAQVYRLMKLGVSERTAQSYGKRQASAVIDSIMKKQNLAPTSKPTPAQLAVLAKHGMPAVDTYAAAAANIALINNRLRIQKSRAMSASH